MKIQNQISALLNPLQAPIIVYYQRGHIAASKSPFVFVLAFHPIEGKHIRF